MLSVKYELVLQQFYNELRATPCFGSHYSEGTHRTLLAQLNQTLYGCALWTSHALIWTKTSQMQEKLGN